MFIRRAIVSNVRSIQDLTWSPGGDRAGWNVILGDNGAGKSSFLRALALCLVGPKEAVAARQDWNAWLRSGSKNGTVSIQLACDPEYDLFAGNGSTDNVSLVNVGVQLERRDDGVGLDKLKV